MPTRQAFRPLARAGRIALASLLLLLAGSASAQNARVGVRSLEFTWEEASGDPDRYIVRISRSGAEEWDHVADNRVRIDVEPGDRVSIQVQAWRRDPRNEKSGFSEPSDPIWILAAPQFPATGSWLVDCRDCGEIELRPLADATLASPQARPGDRWSLEGRAQLYGDDAVLGSWLVWFDWDRSELLFADTEDPGHRIGPFALPEATHVGLIDTQGDGQHEVFLLDSYQNNRVEIYGVTPDGSLRHIIGLPGGNGSSELGPIADYTGDGRDDLLWLNTDARRAEVWSLTDFDPRSGRWQFLDSYLIDIRPDEDLRAAEAGDFDGDGAVDLLWRGADGSFYVTYLAGPAVTRLVPLPGRAGDERLEVVGAVDMDGIPGDEVALQDQESGRLWILYPLNELYSEREAALDPGKDWQAVDVGP